VSITAHQFKPLQLYMMGQALRHRQYLSFVRYYTI
jgi:hypothetical protein